MQASLQSVSTPRPSATAVEEQPYPSWPGAAVAGGVIVAYIVGILLIIVRSPVTVGIGVALLVVGSFALGGLTAVKPGEVRVIQLFGGYRGTVRTTGLRWVNPFSVRLRVSVRIRNKETPTVKVNDADGNPIEIAAVVVWQVRDSAQATYSVENVVTFVDTQSETALRHVANSHSYDASGEGIMSLRDHTDEVGGQVAAELAARVVPAGVEIIESTITRLSYAPEIAQVMLQRQQANAVVAARTRIVEGAVGMVQMALSRLADQDIVELDEERKAAMVSNLLVVLCGDRGTQPIVNAGSLYH